MQPDYDEFAETVRLLAAALRIRVDQVTLSHRGKPVLLLPVTSEPAAASERGRGFSACVEDILATLEAAKEPLTRTKILRALAKQGKEWSDRAVAGHLADLVKDGTLINSTDPPGYKVA